MSLTGRLRDAYLREFNRVSYFQGRPPLHAGAHLPRLDGGRSAYGRRYQPVWDRVAAFLQQHGCDDAEGFMASVFRGKRLPQPHDLYSEQSWLDYHRSLDDYRETRRGELESQDVVFDLAMGQAVLLYQLDELRCARHVLLDTTFPLSALYRYSRASSLGMPDVAQQFREAALEEYHRDPCTYRDVWGDLLPAHLVASSA
jgi:hypothetical protein